MPTNKTKRGPDVWVVPREGRYAIKEEGSSVYLISAVSLRLGISIARSIARANGGELIVQRQLGRIRARDSHGADALAPRV